MPPAQVPIPPDFAALSADPMTAVITGRRTAVMPRSAAIRPLRTQALAPLVIRACRSDAGIHPALMKWVTPSHAHRAGEHPDRSRSPFGGPPLTARRIAARHIAVMPRNGASRPSGTHALAPWLIRGCQAGPRIHPQQLDEVTPSYTPRAVGNACRSDAGIHPPPMEGVTPSHAPRAGKHPARSRSPLMTARRIAARRIAVMLRNGVFRASGTQVPPRPADPRLSGRSPHQSRSGEQGDPVPYPPRRCQSRPILQPFQRPPP